MSNLSPNTISHLSDEDCIITIKEWNRLSCMLGGMKVSLKGLILSLPRSRATVVLQNSFFVLL